MMRGEIAKEEPFARNHATDGGCGNGEGVFSLELQCNLFFAHRFGSCAVLADECDDTLFGLRCTDAMRTTGMFFERFGSAGIEAARPP